ncbi:MAG TPA: Na+/H+ antiporter NhaA [Polyangiaceae bacterium]|nr:Na+/H+ antiporter NhaA [Polyangiaceae bacterium]
MTDGRTRGGPFGTVMRPLQAFLRLEAASGVLLLLAAACAFVWANLHASYLRVVAYPLALGTGAIQTHFTVAELVNDGLMTLFFFVVGMEIKRELVVGELNTVPKASLPVLAAVGGMIVPAGIFLAFNWGKPGQRGWGVPIATDIAFCVGVLTLLQKRVPRALVVFVTALAIFDDIGGILVIALFYGHRLDVAWLLGAAGFSLLLGIFNRQYVRNGLAYAIVGAALWYALHRGGIHATIAGVITGLMIPARPPRPSREVIEDLEAPAQRFVNVLHPYVAYFVMPLFALANSGVSLRGVGLSILATPVALGTALGLFVGKQLGIFATAALTVRLGLAPMPGGAPPSKLYGVAIVAGIGFTVALFIANLAFNDDPALLAQAKAGILLGSLGSGVVGAALLGTTAAVSRYPVDHRADAKPTLPDRTGTI